MKVAILQTDIIWGKPSENQKHAEEAINKALRADMYVLPEMWSTGFASSSNELAENEEESMKSGSVAWMLSTAKRMNAAVCGSVAVRTDNGLCVNRFYFAKPDGTLACYDKRHLFSPGGEDKIYTRGEKRVIVDYNGWRLLPLVCYDLRFPVWSRCDDDYDAIIYVANWPANRQAAWNTLLKARAIENQCHVIAANRCGDDGSCHYGGGSAIVDPYGRVTACAEDGECTVAATLDLDMQNKFRKKFAALGDRDKFTMR